jgi:hypothetical protein
VNETSLWSGNAIGFSKKEEYKSDFLEHFFRNRKISLPRK